MHTLTSVTHTEAFPSLTLSSPSGYQIREDRIVVNLGRIDNHRDLGTTSGSLSVELWALDRPYSGGHFNGVALCGIQVEPLFGQHFLPEGSYDLAFTRPPAGSWHLTLMLREWTDLGFTTRDFVNFDLPYVSESKPAVVRSESDNVISVEFGNRRAGNEAPAIEVAKAPTAKTSTPKEKGLSADSAISLNTASLEQIAGIKGLSKKVAENIVAARPFKSLDDLLTVKGMGAKLLDKIRQFIKL